MNDILRICILIFLYILANISIAQSAPCTFTEVLQIEARSGMRLREKPDPNSRPIGGVPFKAKVDACVESFGSERIEGIDGNWRFVKFNNKVGYMWDGYAVVISTVSTEATGILKSKVDQLPQTASIDYSLEEVSHPPAKLKSELPFADVRLITESYPYCRDIKAIDRGLYYYAVHLEDDYYIFRPVELSIELRNNSPKNALHFNIRPSEGDGSLFIIGLKTPFRSWKKIRNNDFLLTQMNRKLTPGVRLELYATEPGSSFGNVKLMAYGTVKSYDDDCPVIENYGLTVEMMLERKVLFDLSDQLTYRGSCGVPDIYWFGDLNQDGYTDLILVGEYSDYTAFTLFFSQPESAQKYKKMAEWIVEDCN